jgi:hypothetical protein
MSQADALVTCTCTEIKIPDLNLHLRQGDEIWVEADKARESDDLAHARRVRAVSVQWKSRCEEVKAAPPSKRAVRTEITTRIPAPVEPTPAVTATQDLRLLVREEVRRVLREEIKSVVQSTLNREALLAEIVEILNDGQDGEKRKPRTKKPRETT